RDFMRTRKPCVRLRLTTDGWKVRLVAMTLFPAKPRTTRVARRFVAAETKLLRPTDISPRRGTRPPLPNRAPCRHVRQRAPIGEKPRMRRDKPVARQTGLSGSTGLEIGASSTAQTGARGVIHQLSTSCSESPVQVCHVVCRARFA